MFDGIFINGFGLVQEKKMKHDNMSGIVPVQHLLILIACIISSREIGPVLEIR